jgi:hypothetical protein
MSVQDWINLAGVVVPVVTAIGLALLQRSERNPPPPQQGDNEDSRA